MPMEELKLASQQKLLMSRITAIAQDVRTEICPDSTELQSADWYLGWLLGLGMATTLGLLVLRLSVG